LTLVLSEQDLRALLDMKEVVRAVEESFKQQAASKAVNSPRTKVEAPGSLFSVMSASLPYLGRAGVKCYVSTKKGTKFAFLLFRLEDGEPLAVMGADMLGRFRTGAASAVATKHLYGGRDFKFAVFGSGKQALTQVLAMKEVAPPRVVTVWSPGREHRDSFAKELGRLGFSAQGANTPESAAASAEVATAITSSKDPFLTRRSVKSLAHLNLCGSNSPVRAEAQPEAVAQFRTVVVDDLPQSRLESGDLVMAQKRGLLDWERVIELKDVVSGRATSARPSLFKSNGVAIEDVAVASLVYDKASKSSELWGREVFLGGA